MKIRINGNSIEIGDDGDNINISGGRVVVNGKEVNTGDMAGSIKKANTIEIFGNVGEVTTDKSVNCDGVQGDVSAMGSVNCDNVGGDVKAGGSVNCDKVGGNIQAGGSVIS